MYEVIAWLTLIATIISAYFCITEWRLKMLGKPFIDSVTVTKRDGFTCLALQVQPGDFSVRLKAISVPGYRVARAHFGRGGRYQPRLWLPPASSELRDSLPVDVFLRSSSEPVAFWLIISPAVADNFLIKVKTNAIFLTIRFKTTVLKTTTQESTKSDSA